MGVRRAARAPRMDGALVGCVNSENPTVFRVVSCVALVFPSVIETFQGVAALKHQPDGKSAQDDTDTTHETGATIHATRRSEPLPTLKLLHMTRCRCRNYQTLRAHASLSASPRSPSP